MCLKSKIIVTSFALGEHTVLRPEHAVWGVSLVAFDLPVELVYELVARYDCSLIL